MERFSSVDADTMTYSISATATVDSSGAYQQNNQAEPRTLQFSFVEEDGEWRIAASQATRLPATT